MSRSHKALVVIFVATLGVWGCAQNTKGKTKAANTTDDRVKLLEAKMSQLESDYRTVSVSREQLQKKLAEMDRERQRLQQELDAQKVVFQERDELKVTVATRTAERDAYQNHFEDLRKGLRSLLGRSESALPPSLEMPTPVGTTTGPKL